MTKDEIEAYNELTDKIIGAAIEVHKELGPGLLESIYEDCLVMELKRQGMKVSTQVQVPLYYKGEDTGRHFMLDILVEDCIILELKSVSELQSVHEVQLMSYLKLANKRLGLLINFNVPLLKKGIRRKVNNFQ